ncbi:MAG: SDR family NAD(P)-dependent oxidoreductase [Clostridiales bacterium]|nr:SDR family NAD(P)-dependent oxidoreductase [Clostridiales bacterium]
MSGKTVVITGATSGIGLETAAKLAAHGAFVIGTGRSEQKCAEARKKILEINRADNSVKHADNTAGAITFLVADLSSMKQVRKLAGDIREALEMKGKAALDVLINNAGAVSSWYISTAEGFELQFAVNYLAAFLLTNELLPLLEASPDGRVIVLSSGSHYRTKINWRDILMRKHYNVLLAYKQSKLACVMFCTELNRRLGAASGVKAFAADPGLVNTSIGFKGTVGIARKIWEMRSRSGISPEKAAGAIAYLASAPELKASEEVYWKDCKPLKPSGYSRKSDEAKKLWEMSEKMCGIIDTTAQTA